MTAKLQGLSSLNVDLSREKNGINAPPKHDKRTPFRIFLEVIKEPMLALLLAGGLIYLLIGDIKEAIVLIGFALMTIILTIVQEARTEKVLSALRDLSSPNAFVIRDNLRQTISSIDVVLGDLIILEEGARVPADAKLVKASDLQFDESILTGESLAVHRLKDEPILSGTLVVRGHGLALVSAIGINSAIGKIGNSLKNIQVTKPRLQVEMRKLVNLFAIIAVLFCVLVIIIYWQMRGGIIDALLAGIALGMSMLPEELPIVFAIFMAMGAWRISKARVLTRKANAIEALGAANIICTDKTGTLTQNKMTISGFSAYKDNGIIADLLKNVELSIKVNELALFGMLGSNPAPFDPMEKAFFEFCAQNKIEAPKGLELIKSYSLKPDCLAMTQVYKNSNGLLLACKGAPEAVFTLCNLSNSQIKIEQKKLDKLAENGLRVLGIAKANLKNGSLPKHQSEISFEYMGLVGLADPLRDGVIDAINICKQAGIRLIMITGDYPETAIAIAKAANIIDDILKAKILSGEQISQISDDELNIKVHEINIFARILPDQKLRIVKALQARNEVVAMTGDGVNDAPALKAADIGISMGGRGTEVAREASSIVLLDDDFGAIPKAIALGRRIFDNLQKATGFIFAVHLPIAGLAILPLLNGSPMIFEPMHIAFLEMIIDPVCALVFEAEIAEKNIMQRPPRKKNAPFFSRFLIVWSLFQGFIVFCTVATIYIYSLQLGIEANEVRAFCFVTLVICIFALILVNRLFSSSIWLAITRVNSALIYIIFLIFIALSLSLILPQGRDLFHFAPLNNTEFVIAFSLGFGVFIILELCKIIWRFISHNHAQSNLDVTA